MAGGQLLPEIVETRTLDALDADTVQLQQRAYMGERSARARHIDAGGDGLPPQLLLGEVAPAHLVQHELLGDDGAGVGVGLLVPVLDGRGGIARKCVARYLVGPEVLDLRRRPAPAPAGRIHEVEGERDWRLAIGRRIAFVARLGA